MTFSPCQHDNHEALFRGSAGLRSVSAVLFRTPTPSKVMPITAALWVGFIFGRRI
jgi:hypothetical protein